MQTGPKNSWPTIQRCPFMMCAEIEDRTYAQVLRVIGFRQPNYDREPSPQKQFAGRSVPPGHDGVGLPLLVDLVGFTGSGLSHTN
jgi:hypothetical protein